MTHTLSRRIGALESTGPGGPRQYIFKGEAQTAEQALEHRNAGRTGTGLPSLDMADVGFVTFRGL